MTDDELRDELRRLRPATPAPRQGLGEEVMRQLASRPLPRRSWWQRLFVERELQLTLRFRPATLLAGGALAAAVAIVAVRAPSSERHATVAHEAPTSSSPTLVRFALAAQQARAVSLAGDFNGWRPDSTPMVRNPDGTWTATVTLPAGNWSYSFVVDGKWVEDPAADAWREDGFGGRNAIVRVGGG